MLYTFCSFANHHDDLVVGCTPSPLAHDVPDLHDLAVVVDLTVASVDSQVLNGGVKDDLTEGGDETKDHPDIDHFCVRGLRQ